MFVSPQNLDVEIPPPKGEGLWGYFSPEGRALVGGVGTL